jgi:hypothetical protein
MRPAVTDRILRWFAGARDEDVRAASNAVIASHANEAASKGGKLLHKDAELHGGDPCPGLLPLSGKAMDFDANEAERVSSARRCH